MIYLINPEVAEISSQDRELFEIQKNLFTVSRYIRMNNLLSKALEEMRWHDQPRILLEMYLLKMSEPYYNVSELISRIDELEKNVIGTSDIQKDISEKKEKKIVTNISTTANLMSIWPEIVSEIIKEHPLTAQPLKKTVIKVTGDTSVQLTVSGQFDYESVIGFLDQIVKLFHIKTGLDIKIEVLIEKNVPLKQQHNEDIVIKENISQACDEYSVKEDLKEMSKTSVPKYIQDIAKKFKSTAKKITDGK
jgi:DNA polymerase-3 subunit gamma/tau